MNRTIKLRLLARPPAPVSTAIIQKMNHMFEQIDPESHQTREVYARYGLAMYHAQCLEISISILLATVLGPGTSKISRKEYDELFESYFKKTFGALSNEIKKKNPKEKELLNILNKLQIALKKRNWLAHNYFYERAAKFNLDKGRKEMITELNQISSYFEELDDSIENIQLKWAKSHGISEEFLQKTLKRLIEPRSRVNAITN